MTGAPRRLRASLSASEARRVALAAQGFGPVRADRPGRRRILGLVERLGALQVDSVNVLARAHYLPVFSRLGPYDRADLDRARDVAPRGLVEYWAHEASLVPVALRRFFGWRMRRWQQDAWRGMRRVAAEHPALVDAVLAEVRDRGPLTAGEAEVALEHDLPRSRTAWGWNWSLVKQCLEHLFWIGAVTSAGRTASFERRYDLPERVLPPQAGLLGEPSDEEAYRELVRIAARACGVATSRTLRDYFRMPPAQAATAVSALVEAGDLEPVAVQGWSRPAYLFRGSRLPRRVSARAVLAPFDPLLWDRSRVLDLFGMRYRVEIYVPVSQRVHGYYVLPFLLGDRLVARVDLKADRAGQVLVVRAASLAEPDPTSDRAGDAGEVAEGLAAELASVAGWLGLSAVAVEPSGDLAGVLARALTR